MRNPLYMKNLCLSYDFLRSGQSECTQMHSALDPWFPVSMVLLFTVLLFLRSRFPKPSKLSETAVFVLAGLCFFGLCFLFLPHTRVLP